MRTYRMLLLALIIFGVSTVSIVYSAGPSDEAFRGAYKQILSQADTNKDGKLSLTECKAIYKDKTMAEKNCTFWDVDHDGVITEDEYVQQAWSMGKKKK
jgi:Ca2+-binding EF-hand superfamily protein